jgi:putative ABC transport system permease protein
MRRFLLELNESVRIAFAQIRANKMRSFLTTLGVIIGIVAMTLMGTGIAGINTGVQRGMEGFGDDVLYVTKWPWRGVEDWWNYRNRRPIRNEYARQINEWIAAREDTTLQLAVPTAEGNATIVRGDSRVNGVYVLATTVDYPRLIRSEIDEGRYFSDLESQAGRNVLILGADVADALFRNESPIGKKVRINGQTFEVIGLGTRQGKFLGIFSMDSNVIMPLGSFRRYFRTGDNGDVRVKVDKDRMDEARDELRGLMRRLRGLQPEQRDDFEINEQKVVREQLDKMKAPIFFAGLTITGLALLVGAIGIMNITYVSVKERTREIGTRKALGARRGTILLQFLIEAVSICMLGGVIGLSITAGLSSLIGAVFPAFPIEFPVVLVVISIGASVLVGVVSGFAPAFTASRLDPVEALRYE